LIIDRDPSIRSCRRILMFIPVSPLWEPPAGTFRAMPSPPPRVLDRRDGRVLPGIISTDLEAGCGLLGRLAALRRCLSSLREATAVRIPRVPLQ
jgi:hypothetical protein